MNKCLKCEKEAINWFCRYHYLEKEMIYGVYDLKTNNKGFRVWGIKRILRFYLYKYLGL